MFSASRLLLFAKTAVKEVPSTPTSRSRLPPLHSLTQLTPIPIPPLCPSRQTAAPKKRAAPGASAKKVKAAAKVRDPSLPPPSSAFTLPQLIEKIPAPAPGTPPTEWQHKGGWGLKFYRKQWAKYPEPSYWTVTRYKPSTHGHKRKVWGVLTWRGQRTHDTHTQHTEGEVGPLS